MSLVAPGALTIANTSPGVVFLNGSGNAWSGGTTISSGTLQIGDPNGTSVLSLPGNVTNNGTINFKPSTNAFSYGGIISGTGSLQMLGTNVLTLTSANTYGGTTIIDAGTVLIGIDNALPTTTALRLDGPYAGNGNVGATLNVANNQTVDHFSGSTTAGTSITIALGKTFTVSQASSVSSTYDGVISGSGKLVVTGSATSSPFSGTTTQFTGSNTFSGGTTINGGQLKIATGGVLGTGGITVNSGGLLTGSGSFTGALVINSGASIAVSSTLSGGTTTFNGGSTYFWALANATGVSGTNFGLLNITGGLTLSATSGNRITIAPITFNGGSQGVAANFDTTQNYSFTLATTTTGITGFDATAFTLNMSSFQNAYTGTWAVGTSGNNLVLNYTGGSAIPEPATSALLAGLAACGLALRRRRRSQP